MKYVYQFSEGNQSMRSLLGGKGANLAEMARGGLPVPDGMIITTDACRSYYRENNKLPTGLLDEVRSNLKQLEQNTGLRLGDPEAPLLVSVRSGSVFSMPGMMDTILNLGLNEQTLQGLIKRTGNPRFVHDAYRRFIQMFGDVAMNVSREQFDAILDAEKKTQGVKDDQELSAEALRSVIDQFRELYRQETGSPFPDDPFEQLTLAVEAVFRSWNNHRAIVYRNINRIDHNLGTAVSIQRMVFGNMGNDCGTGVAFTRNPSTGEKALYGEYLVNAQGEDVVAGIRTPRTIAELSTEMPEMYEQFNIIANRLEAHFHNMQDIEFTIEKGKLFILQTRNGKRTGRAALKIACDMVQEGTLTKAKALLMLDAEQLAQMLHRQIDDAVPVNVLAKGLPASPGAAVGTVVFSADEAEEFGKLGKKVILVRMETTPDDIHGIVQAQGILTSRGGMTSHAAVVARGMGKPCVCGCEAIKVDYRQGLFTVGDITVKKGELIAVDGSTGRVVVGQVVLKDPELPAEYLTVLEWADEFRRLEVRANADTPADARKALEFGAGGIGLTRTEHMFMAQDRLPWMQQMILSETPAQRAEALSHLLEMQEGDFYGILKVMAGCPVCIRLLDPPLHEFLPSFENLLKETVELQVCGNDPVLLAQKEALLKQVQKLHENNPMMGHRGCRLGITYPEVYEMQANAICNAAARLTAEGVRVMPEIEVPLTMCRAEMAFFRERIDRIATEAMTRHGATFVYEVGSMIELPRAALLADELAEHATFFSFGTNDLTQMCFGFSRDDAEGKFLPDYIGKGILKEDPFIVLDRAGVGKLMEIAVEKGRNVRPGMTIGICGEHGGEPDSIEFCHQIGLTYVSCSPYRVPIARLAAAQAALREANAK